MCGICGQEINEEDEKTWRWEDKPREKKKSYEVVYMSIPRNWDDIEDEFGVPKRSKPRKIYYHKECWDEQKKNNSTDSDN